MRRSCSKAHNNNKISGEKYLQYNTNYLNAIWSPLDKLNLKN